jgi:hypothetical protein
MADVKLSFPVSGVDLTGLEKTHHLVRFTPDVDLSAAFSLVLPKTWQMEDDLGPQPNGLGQMMRIGLFLEKQMGADMTIVQVYLTRLPFEVALRDWMEYLAGVFQTQLVTLQEYEFAIGSVVDAGGLYGPPSNQHVVRIVVHADGGRMFAVCAMVRADRYPATLRDIAIATNSFKLLHPAGPNKLETLLKYTGGEPRFEVAYPASWVSKEVPKPLPGKSGIDVVLSSEERMLGYLRIKAISVVDGRAPSSDSLQQTAIEELQVAGVTPTTKWAPDTDPSINRVKGLSSILVASARFMGKPSELRFGTLRRGALIFALTLLSIPKATDAILWMRSKRAYEIGLATVQPAS